MFPETRNGSRGKHIKLPVDGCSVGMRLRAEDRKARLCGWRLGPWGRGVNVSRGQTLERGEGRSQELGKACLIHSGKLHFAPSLESNCEIRLLIEKLGKQEFQSRSEAAQPFAR